MKNSLVSFIVFFIGYYRPTIRQFYVNTEQTTTRGRWADTNWSIWLTHAPIGITPRHLLMHYHASCMHVIHLSSNPDYRGSDHGVL